MPPCFRRSWSRRWDRRAWFGVLLGLAVPACGPDPQQLRNQARAAAQAGRWDEAERSLGKLADPTPADRLLQAQAALARGHDDRARKILGPAPSDGDLGAQREFLLGRIALNEHHARDAEAALRRSLAIDPNRADARRALIYLLGIQSRRRETLEQFAELAERGPLTPSLVHDWCISHETIGDPVKVVPDLQKFVDGDPADVPSRLALADALRQLGRYDQAEETLAPLDQTDPDVVSLRVDLATAQGDSDAIERLLGMVPEDHAKLARQRGLLALARRDYPGALKHLRIADQAEPNSRDVLLGLSQALRGLGETEPAEKLLKRVAAQHAIRTLLIRRVDHPATTPDDFRELGAACEAADWIDEARAWYRLAISASPLDAQAQQALYRLRTRPGD